MRLSDDQLARRRGVGADATIGSSEAAALVGAHPFMTAWELYERKTIATEWTPDAETQERFELGHDLEDIIAGIVTRRLGLASVEAVSETVTHAQYPWATATPDFISWGPPVQILEIKNVGYTMLRDWPTPREAAETGSRPPLYVEAQCLWQMAVLRSHGAQIDSALVGALLGGRQVVVLEVPWDADAAQGLLDAGQAFMDEHVLLGRPLPLDGSDAASRYLARRYPARATERAELAEATEEIDRSAEELAIIRRLGEHIQRAEQRAVQRLQAQLGDASAVRGWWGKLSWQDRRGRSKTDWVSVIDDIAREHSLETSALDAIVARHTTHSPPLRVFVSTFDERVYRAPRAIDAAPLGEAVEHLATAMLSDEVRGVLLAAPPQEKGHDGEASAAPQAEAERETHRRKRRQPRRRDPSSQQEARPEHLAGESTESVLAQEDLDARDT
jgi:predicted phage-related endonuclease